MRDDEEKYEIVYIMKYALTFGIVKARAAINGRGYAHVDDDGFQLLGRWNFNKREFVKTEQDAKVAFQNMIAKKQANLRKQIKRLDVRATLGPLWRDAQKSPE